MKMRLRSYGDEGNLSEERIGFQVLRDCNLKFFVVYHTNITDGGFYNRPSDVFWFYPKDVKAGDEVVLYTKEGTDSSEKKADGHTIHFFYWGLNSPIIVKGDCIVLSEVEDWSVTRFNKLK